MAGMFADPDELIALARAAAAANDRFLSRLLSDEYAASFPPVPGDTEELLSARMRKAHLSLLHPSACPDDLVGPLPYLISEPSGLARTSSWVRFRDALLCMMAESPDDPHFPKFLRCVEAGLAWRATIPPENRFWRKEDARDG